MRLPTHSHVRPPTASPRSGALLLTGGAGGEVRAWDLRTREMKGHAQAGALGQRVCGLAALADSGGGAGAGAAVCCEGRSWGIWDVAAGKCLASWQSQ
jgi:hypothetical protein